MFRLMFTVNYNIMMFWIIWIICLTVPQSTHCDQEYQASICYPQIDVRFRCTPSEGSPVIIKAKYGKIWPLLGASTNNRCNWEFRIIQPDFTVEIPPQNLTCHNSQSNTATSCIINADWSTLDGAMDEEIYKGNSYFEINYLCKQNSSITTTTPVSIEETSDTIPETSSITPSITEFASTPIPKNGTKVNKTIIEEQNYFSENRSENYAIGFSVVFFSIFIMGLLAVCATILRKNYKKKKRKLEEQKAANSNANMIFKNRFSSATYHAGRFIDTLHNRTQTMFRRKKTVRTKDKPGPSVDDQIYGIYMEPDDVSCDIPETVNNPRPPPVNPDFNRRKIDKHPNVSCMDHPDGHCNGSYECLHPNPGITKRDGNKNGVKNLRPAVNGEYDYVKDVVRKVKVGDVGMALVVSESKKQKCNKKKGNYVELQEECKVENEMQCNDVNKKGKRKAESNNGKFYNVCKEDSDDSEAYPEYDNATLIRQTFRDGTEKKKKNKKSFDNPGYIDKEELIIPISSPSKVNDNKVNTGTQVNLKSKRKDTARKNSKIGSATEETDIRVKKEEAKIVKKKPTYAVINKNKKDNKVPKPKKIVKDDDVNCQKCSPNKPRLPTKKVRQIKEVENKPVDEESKPRLHTKKYRKQKRNNDHKQRSGDEKVREKKQNGMQEKPRLDTKVKRQPKEGEVQNRDGKPRLPTKVKRKPKDEDVPNGEGKPRLPTRVKRPKKGENIKNPSEKPRLPTKVKRTKVKREDSKKKPRLPTKVERPKKQDVTDTAKPKEAKDQNSPPPLPKERSANYNVHAGPSNLNKENKSKVNMTNDRLSGKSECGGNSLNYDNKTSQNNRESSFSVISMEDNAVYDHIADYVTKPTDKNVKDEMLSCRCSGMCTSDPPQRVSTVSADSYITMNQKCQCNHQPCIDDVSEVTDDDLNDVTDDDLHDGTDDDLHDGTDDDLHDGTDDELHDGTDDDDDDAVQTGCDESDYENLRHEASDSDYDNASYEYEYETDNDEYDNVDAEHDYVSEDDSDDDYDYDNAENTSDYNDEEQSVDSESDNGDNDTASNNPTNKKTDDTIISAL